MLCPHIPPGHRVRYSRNPDDAAPERVPGPDDRRRTDKPFRRSRIPRRNTFFPVQFQNPAVAAFSCAAGSISTLLFPARGYRFRPAQKNPVTAVPLLRRKRLRQAFCFAVRSIHKIEAHLHSAAADHAKPLPLSGSEIVFSVFTFLLLHQLLRMQNRLIFQVSAADSSENPVLPGRPTYRRPSCAEWSRPLR